jgi:hypothetical protein
VIGEPPSEAGGLHAIVIWSDDAELETRSLGSEGAVAGGGLVVAAASFEGSLVPISLMAETL